jgi:hypothetical protein
MVIIILITFISSTKSENREEKSIFEDLIEHFGEFDVFNYNLIEAQLYNAISSFTLLLRYIIII